MADVNGNPGFTQLEKLNVTEELLIKGLPVVGGSGTFAENVIIINEVSELDAYESGGKYVLDGNYVYDFSALNGITLPYAFDVSAGGIVIKAETALYAMLFYFGTDPLFQGANLDIRNITIFAPSAEIFSLTKTGSADYFLANTVLIAAAAKYGTFDLHDINIINCGSIDVQQGITLNGSDWNTTRIDGLNLQSSNPAFVGLDISTALLSDPKFDSVVMNAPAGAIGLNSIGKDNIQAGEVCSWSNGNIFGGMSAFGGGVSDSSVRFRFVSNGGVKDSTITANPRLTTTTLVVLTQNVFSKVNANWSSSFNDRLSVSANGDIENITEQVIKIGFDGYVTVDKVGGGSEYVVARLVLNDDPNSSESEATENGTQANQPTSIPLNEVFEMDPGDKISVYIANTGSNANVNVVNGKIKCNRLR